MDTAKIEAWLLNEKDLQDSSLRATSATFLRRSKPKPMYPNRDWTNPNRFSDPLNRVCRVQSSAGPPALPGRPNKAYTWYLDNQLPRRCAAASMSRTSWEDKLHSLFGNGAGCQAEAGTDENGIRKRHSGGVSNTWERVRQQKQGARAANRLSNTLDNGSAALASGRLSPRVFSQRRLSPFSGRQPGCGDLGSQRGSPCSSQRSSASPQGTLSRLSPSLLGRHSPCQRLSPTPQRASSMSPGGRIQQALAQATSSRSSFVSQWVNNSLSPYQLSPFSARSSRTSCSGREEGDVSFGSETDDDFFYISCGQLTKGLADLSMTSTPQPPLRQTTGNRVVENPSFAPTAASGDYVAEYDDDFDGCSDDALSDDVFLDNPQPLTVSTVGKVTSQPQQRAPEPSSSAELSKQTSDRHRDHGQHEERNARDSDGNTDTNTDAGEHVAMERLRRNSVQNKLRQTWRHRRHKAAGHPRAETVPTTAGEVSTESSSGDSPLPPDQSLPQNSTSNATDNDSQPLPVDEESTVEPHEAKPCYYYVISPTDDVDMPDVIAVRRSSVELIRWQNSLRRRRRRQAKRHDLGRKTKREPKTSATV